MTVCLAALCREGEHARAVVAADRMVTLGGFIEFEHAVSKMTTAGTSGVVMVAGDTLVGTRLAQDAIEAMAGGSHSVADTARALAAHYDSARQQLMEEAVLRPRGLTLQTFYQAHTSLQPNVIVSLDNALANYNLGVELLLAGVDASGGHVHTVHNPGGSERLHDTIGYAAIGSGAIHALQAMIGFQHCSTASYLDTVFRVYASKRRAEVAPGVGHDTDVAVISATGVRWLGATELEQLEQVYAEYEASTTTGLEEKLQAIDLGKEETNALSAQASG